MANRNLDEVQAGSIQFFGTSTAELLTRQVKASFHGVLTRNMVTDPSDPLVGFVSASIDGRRIPELAVRSPEVRSPEVRSPAEPGQGQWHYARDITQLQMAL